MNLPWSAQCQGGICFDSVSTVSWRVRPDGDGPWDPPLVIPPNTRPYLHLELCLQTCLPKFVVACRTDGPRGLQDRRLYAPGEIAR